MVAAKPPKCPLLATDLINIPVSCELVILNLSPRTAPPEKGLVGSTAKTPTLYPFSKAIFDNKSTIVDFPAPGGPVIPMI